MAPHDDILFSEIPGKKGNLGEITLNRPKALNALTGDMCRRLHEQLLGWESDRTIKAVVIKGAGDRAFCAGGDIRTLYMNGKEHLQTAQKFFYDEYRMNAAIFHFKKTLYCAVRRYYYGRWCGRFCARLSSRSD